jgi:hypothetical protein
LINEIWICNFFNTVITLCWWKSPFELGCCIRPLSESEFVIGSFSEHEGSGICDRVEECSSISFQWFTLTVRDGEVLDLFLINACKFRCWALSHLHVDLYCVFTSVMAENSDLICAICGEVLSPEMPLRVASDEVVIVAVE